MINDGWREPDPNASRTISMQQRHERMVWVKNRGRHTVHELDCKKLLAIWANPQNDITEASFTKMPAADVPLTYHRCRICAPGIG